jgi:hypothetical protein
MAELALDNNHSLLRFMESEYWVPSGEATNSIFTVSGLTRPGLQPTIYHTQGEHANHYTTLRLSKEDKQHNGLFSVGLLHGWMSIA